MNPPHHGGGEGEWERAYLAFESPEEETAKFVRRLRRLAIGPPSEDLRVLELFAGRANGLSALARLGFRRLFALDRSLRLLGSSGWRARSSAGDARQLPYRDGTVDVVVIQGGLHHLEVLPEDFDATLEEIVRVLKPSGRLFVVEPDRTPFLAAVHAICRWRIARKLSRKVDALARMIELESPTYEQWLEQGDRAVASLSARFEMLVCERRWGKLLFAGRSRR
ncbi:MAG TPA: class I SAM-dependent methyltransferase [Thermoanaerobaculia bacterium]